MLCHSDLRPRRPARRRSSGFSLVEILVVVAIISLLLTLVGPAAMRHLQASRSTTAETQIRQLRAALDIFHIDVGRYPTEEEGLRALVLGDPTNNGWNGPYLRDGALPKDPWGNHYRYTLVDGRPILSSLGADGKPGGEGEDSDI